jgi:hypothetical protein
VSLPEIGACMIALAIAMYAVNRFAKLRCWLIFLGPMVAGLGGLLTGIAARGLGLADKLFGTLGGTVLGVTAGTVLAAGTVVAGFLVLHDLHPKGSGKKRTFWLAGILGIACTLGLTPFAALNNLPSQVQTGITSTQSGG